MELWKIVVFIIIVAILLLWLIGWLTSRKNKSVYVVARNDNNGKLVQKMTPINVPIAPISVQTGTSPFTVYMFYSNNCVHCANFKPVWENVKAKFSNNANINFVDVDCNNPANENICFYYNIKTTPVLILVTPNKNIEFNGARTVDAISNFITNNISEYNVNYPHQFIPDNQFSVNETYSPTNF